jgi:hypothetical protein
MYDVLPQPPDDMSIARADPSACRVMLTPPICTMGEDAHFTQYDVLATLGNGRHLMMGDDPRLPKMPARPRLADFFRHRFVPMVANHLERHWRLPEFEDEIGEVCARAWLRLGETVGQVLTWLGANPPSLSLDCRHSSQEVHYKLYSREVLTQWMAEMPDAAK